MMKTLMWSLYALGVYYLLRLVALDAINQFTTNLSAALGGA